jgi:hypothetical protein
MKSILSAKLAGIGHDALPRSLHEVLMRVPNGDEFEWSILWLKAVGNFEDRTMLDYEEEINLSENGLRMKWNELVEFSTRIYQTIEILLIGDKDSNSLKRYTNDDEMYLHCYYNFELIDSSYWLIHTKDEKLMKSLQSIGDKPL